MLFVSKAGPACLCGTRWVLNSFTAFSFLPPLATPQVPFLSLSLSLCLKSQGLQKTQLCFCFLSPGPQLIWSPCNCNYRHICTVQGGGRCVSSLRGWERNGLDLGLQSGSNFSSHRAVDFLEESDCWVLPRRADTRHVEEIHITELPKQVTPPGHQAQPVSQKVGTGCLSLARAL